VPYFPRDSTLLIFDSRESAVTLEGMDLDKESCKLMIFTKRVITYSPTGPA